MRHWRRLRRLRRRRRWRRRRSIAAAFARRTDGAARAQSSADQKVGARVRGALAFRDKSRLSGDVVHTAARDDSIDNRARAQRRPDF